MAELPTPEPGRVAAEAFVAAHFGHLVDDDVVASPAFRGGQTAADMALAGFDVAGYASRRNEVHPDESRGASRLSPYIRHGLLTLSTVWQSVAGGPAKDVRKFRDELLWQEYARHWYAHHGTATRHGIRRELLVSEPSIDETDMACLEFVTAELEGSGWLVNQTRMWFASHWSVRQGRTWRDGENHFFRHLLDGSRAANRLGWQWTTGVGSAKPYGFSRWQVEKRAPRICAGCARRDDCPIADWPDDPDYQVSVASLPAPSGPPLVATGGTAEAVWLTAESLGDDDPALAADPDLPAIFVFDEPLLSQLRLSAKRLVFLTETLAELATHRPVELYLGAPVDVLAERAVGVTRAPVPGFDARAQRIRPVELYDWPWLCAPSDRPVGSFSSWRKRIREP